MAGKIGRLLVMNYDDMRIVQEISSPTDRRRRTKMETGGGVVEATIGEGAGNWKCSKFYFRSQNDARPRALF